MSKGKSAPRVVKWPESTKYDPPNNYGNGVIVGDVTAVRGLDRGLYVKVDDTWYSVHPPNGTNLLDAYGIRYALKAHELKERGFAEMPQALLRRPRWMLPKEE